MQFVYSAIRFANHNPFVVGNSVVVLTNVVGPGCHIGRVGWIRLRECLLRRLLTLRHVVTRTLHYLRFGLYRVLGGWSPRVIYRVVLRVRTTLKDFAPT